MSYIIFPNDPNDTFDVLVSKNRALLQKLFNMTFNYQNVTVERISFIDYTNKKIIDSFPIGKRICINNTSTIEMFGLGKYDGYFFDVILRLPNGNPMNYRIFYDIYDENNK